MYAKLPQQNLPHRCKKLDIDRAVVIGFWKPSEYFEDGIFHEAALNMLIRSEAGGPASKHTTKYRINVI